MELLAPAGSLAVFETAIEQGADAVYIGAPALNARALARNFTRAELAAMVSYAHRQGVKVYLAMNSLLKEDEIPLAVESLAFFAAIKPDALIIQDLGIYYLIKTYFPELRIHASTLMAAHNSMTVQHFARMGFSRVVLARELSLREISAIHKKNSVALEAFVHGALCFSYSGLCLFSSYLGGKSGLRGRCVQPCRRRYAWAAKRGGRASTGKGGYLFSMSDLAGIDLLPQLRAAGITSLKLEGRLRSANYVGAVVKAYRTVLDTMDADAATRENALRRAKEYLRESMGRRTTSGYFPASPPDIIVPQHSGNIGIFMGRAGTPVKDGRVRLTLKAPLAAGDRLRLHQEKSGERLSFTVKMMWEIGGKTVREVKAAAQGVRVDIKIPAQATVGDSLFKVDRRERRLLEGNNRVGKCKINNKKAMVLVDRTRLQKVLAALAVKPDRSHSRRRKTAGPPKDKAQPALWLKVDNPRMLAGRLPIMPERIVVSLGRQTIARLAGMKKFLKRYRRRIIWSLPPVIREEDLDFYRKTIRHLLADDYKTWQIGHIGQCRFFEAGPRPVRLVGDYTLNILNSLSLETLKQFGIEQAQIGIETDRENLQRVCGSLSGRRRQPKGRRGRGTALDCGLTVYGMPPLFTARLTDAHFQYGRQFISPRGERFVLEKSSGLTLALPEKPFSLLGLLPELAAVGVEYVVIDLSHMKTGRHGIEDLGRQIAGAGRRQRLGAFNYLGSLE